VWYNSVVKTQPATTDVRITFRLPEDLHAQVAELARRHLRSLNAELVYLLRDAIAQNGAANLPTARSETDPAAQLKP
jgi:hypothetical protein